MDIAAVILNWNQAEMTEVAVNSVADDTSHIYLLDNGSRSDDLERLRVLASVEGRTLIENGCNLGYGAGNNPGIQQALRDGHDALLLMNNDAWAEPGALHLLAHRLAEEPEVGAVQPMVVATSGDWVMHTTCSLDVRRGQLGWDDVGRALAEVETQTRQTDWLSGEAFLARAEVFNQIGAFDGRYFIYFEDVDWSVRAWRAGWRLETVGSAVFRHAVSASMPSVGGAYHGARSRVLFLRHCLGMSRAAALRLSSPVELRRIAGYAKRGHFQQIMRGAVPGVAAGLKDP